MHDLLSVNRISAWAGAGSELHLIPFNEDAARTIDFGPKTALCAPSTDEKKALWPYNAVVDWCWGTRIVTAFGTTEIWQFSQESETSQAVQRYRRAFRKRGRDGLGGEAEEVEIGEQS